MSIWLKNLVGIFFILHALVYGIMLIPFPEMPGNGMGKYWSDFTGSRILSAANISNNRLKIIAIILSLAALAGYIIAGSIILSAGVPDRIFLITSIISAGLSVIFLILYWHNYNIVGFIINIAILIIIPYLYIKLQ